MFLRHAIYQYFFVVAVCFIMNHAECMETKQFTFDTPEFKALIAPVLVTAKKLAEQHANKNVDSKPIIAIAGCSAVGKSAFTRELKKLLEAETVKVSILQQDDFLQPERVAYSIGDPTKHAQFDYLRLHAVIQQILGGQEQVRKPIWNKTGPKPVKEDVVANFKDVDLLLFEGLYTLSGPDSYDLGKYKQYGIFINAPVDAILDWNWQRELAAKGREPRAREKFDSDVAWDMQDYYKVVLPTKDFADCILEKDSKHQYVSIIQKKSE